MILNNRAALIIFSALAGAGNTVGLVGAPSYLLSVLNPTYALLTLLASGIAFYVFQRQVHLKRMKFAVFSAITIALYALLLASLGTSFYATPARAVGWSFMAVFGTGLSRWIVMETANLHLDPIRGKSFFSHMPIAYESGMLLTLAALKAVPGGLNPFQMIFTASALCLAAAGFVCLHFVPERNREIKFAKREEDPPPLEPETSRALNRVLLLVAATIGTAVVCEEHLIRVVLKEELVSYEAIRNMVTNYRLAGSFIMIVSGFAVGRIIQKKHLSPARLLTVNSAILAALAVACLGKGAFYAFVAFEAVKRILEQTLYAPANGIVFSFFTTKIRNLLRARENFCYFYLPTLPLTALFWYTPALGSHGQRVFILALILAALAANLAALGRLGPILAKAMYERIKTGHKTASILAIQALSYLRPKGYGQRLKQLLEIFPKKLLKKNVILALAYAREEESVDAIIGEFRSGHEEIQLSAIDALKIARTHQAVHFMTRILSEKEAALSTRVKMNAAMAVAELCGKSSIPLLLEGLDHPDERVVANTLETLDLFRDRGLIPYFAKYLDSGCARIVSQALMALSRFRKTRAMYRSRVQGILTQRADKRLMASVLYIIGRLRDHHFHRELTELARSPLREDDRLKPGLAWALTKTHDKKTGFELFTELARQADDELHIAALQHYYTMLPEQIRMELIEHMTVHNLDDRGFLRRMGTMLRNSGMAFHQELDHLHFIVQDSAVFVRKAQVA